MNTSVTPILRIFDYAKTKEFYVDFLEFTIDWEHRFEENMPVYLSVSSGPVTLHLSEHHGDGSPGTRVRIHHPDVEQFQKQLLAKKYKYMRPGLEEMPWNTVEMTVVDPFNNRLTYWREK